MDELDADDASDFDYPSGNHDQKPKAADKMIGWHMNYEKGGTYGLPKYDSGEIPRNNIPLLTHSRSQEVCYINLF